MKLSLPWRTRSRHPFANPHPWIGSGISLGRGSKGALAIVPVYAATNLIADHLASAPLHAYRDAGGRPQRLPEQPALCVDPGVGLDRYSWVHQAATSVLLQGNAYGLIQEIDGRGIPAKVAWLRPEDVSISVVDGAVTYRWRGEELPRADLIHIPGYVLPGSPEGLSPIGLFRVQLETGLEAQTFGRRFFTRGTMPNAIFKNEKQKVNPQDAAAVKARLNLAIENHEPMVVGADWEYTAVQLPAADVQFLAGVRATANQIAAAYRVAPEDVGGSIEGGTSITYKNLEQDQLRFATRTLRPWAARFEAVFNRFLPAGEYVRFNLDASVRADLLTRYKAHELALKNGFKLIDEVRALEELPPIDTV
ncbi:phage portal protein [Microcella frigidaquae]|uniref:HK97 family phage portal protein n=1 Tax=Microcella frigidaquae TaxID=424758 RepID=A0A840XNN7_9MICO|nr:phage portal protein [Microcella frigidaquae]MBB5618447.1 HK97 family phage portal protein [Microcella frigidaquae]NHN44652.1 phage portal protein [Microcella frigidaquae]